MGFIHNLRYALRTLRRSPAYLATCIAVLALGMGANVAIFSVVYSVILKPLPFRDPSMLVFVWEHFPGLGYPLAERIEVARSNYLEWKRENNVFTGMAAFRGGTATETGAEHARHISIASVSSDFFPLIGVPASLGRLFRPDEEHKGDDRVAIVTDAYFEQRFHRDRAALGKPLTLDGVAYTVIGVLPPAFHLPATREGLDQLKPDVWIPLSHLWNTPDDDTQRQLMVVARLKPGVSLAQARTEVAGIGERLAQSDKKLNEGWKTSVFPFAVEDTAPTLHRALYVLLGAVGFLLLIACANLANLTLARATLRSREIAVRLALGATRANIIEHLVTESLLVSFAGAACGLLLARWSIQLMLALEPPDIQRPELIAINLPVFVFAVAAAVLTTLLFGLAPSIAASRADLNTALKTGGGWGTSASRVRSRQFLIAIEVTLALVLLSGAGLMIRSFQALVSTGIGFETTQLMAVDIDLPDQRYHDPASRSRFFQELIQRADATPGATGSAVIDNLPLHRISMQSFHIADRPDPGAGTPPVSDYANVSPRYFSLIGLRLLAGRLFTDADLVLNEKEKDGVAIVNQAFARQFFRGEDPVGKRLLESDRKVAWEIIGVVADYRPLGAENGTRPQIFWPFLKHNAATLIVRTRGTAKELQNAVWELDKDLPASDIKPMAHYVDGWQAQRRFNTLLLAIFAGLALALAMMGIYGVLSNLVASRVREIGIRMAIGASAAEIGMLVLRQSMAPVAIGLAVGLAGSLALSRYLEALLFQVHSRDPLTLAFAACTILLISPAAIYFPLRRATRVDCTVALRDE